jgi:FAD/FMN-containing dehydrogenase
MRKLESWGRYPKTEQRWRLIHWRDEPLGLENEPGPVLPYGLGRSYGDACLNDGGLLLETRGLNRFIAFDRQTGLLRCEAGVSLAEIIEVCLPHGWFLPVTPGTKFVTVGGAIAADVHGKNHHRAGTFARHVLRFELLRSTGERLLCSRDSHPEWFAATVAGLGLTGLITWAEIQLRPVRSRRIAAESVPFANLSEFFPISAESERDYEYTVAWVDCTARGAHLGRGIFMRGNHAESGPLAARRQAALRVPFDFPGFVLNPLTVRLFNSLYYWKQLGRRTRGLLDINPFFYPLDAVLDWNRIYGRRGFLQWQCVVPYGGDESTIREILDRIARAGKASFLAVLKVFGDQPSPGLLAFPRPGVTLALDFRIDAALLRLLDGLDAIVRQAGGAIYPVKDARMSAADFQAFYPQWRRLAEFADPLFSSSFWRRVTAPASATAPAHVPAGAL